MPEDVAERELRHCCGSTRWARAMAAARPFASAEEMQETADKLWSELDVTDWQEAFAAHPRIGEKAKMGPGEHGRSGPEDSGHEDWSAAEQARVQRAGDAVRARLAAANRAYDARFGHIFIVSASGKSAEEILAILERRLTNEPDHELKTAAEEQRKITRLRIAKLLE